MSVEPVRKAAERLLKLKADFVYCELPNEKHGFPPSAERDWFHFASPRRRRKAKSGFPRWSHARKPSSSEVEGLGDPTGAWGTTLSDDAAAESLLAILRRGQLDAEPAARRLVAVDSSAETKAGLREIVGDRDVPTRGRAWSSWALGALKDDVSVDALGGVLRSSDDAMLLTHAAAAVEQIGSRDSMEDVRWALLEVARRYKAVQGKTIPFVEFERACRLGASLARALGRVGQADAVQADFEESLVIGILRDRRTVTHRPDHGEDPGRLKAALAEDIGRAYKTLGVDKTVLDLLVTVVRKQPAVRQAALRGWREGLPPID